LDEKWEVFLITLKGIEHPKINILSSFTHPHVVPNLYDFNIFFYVLQKNVGHTGLEKQ